MTAFIAGFWIIVFTIFMGFQVARASNLFPDRSLDFGILCGFWMFFLLIFFAAMLGKIS